MGAAHEGGDRSLPLSSFHKQAPAHDFSEGMKLMR